MFFINAYALDSVVDINTDGLKAASYIITQKYMLDKVSVYCGELAGKEEDWAPAVMAKWLNINEKHYSVAVKRVEEYVQHTHIKYGPALAKETRKKFKQLFTDKGDKAVSEHFSKFDNEQDKQAECSVFIEQLDSGALNINESNEDIAVDMKKLLNPHKLTPYEGQN